MAYRRNSDLVTRARQLRREMTPQEKHLWYDYLRHYPVKIYRQRVIGQFIADFYCHAARLVIEIDGAQHYTPDGLARDAERTTLLTQMGLKVLRFKNSDVEEHFLSVCKHSPREIQNRSPHPESPQSETQPPRPF